MVIFNFIFDQDVSLFSRVKRSSKSPTSTSEGAPQNANNDALTARGYADSDAVGVN